VALDIFTNTSWVPKKRIFDMLSKFEYCQIFLSVDGTGTVQEYMRHNSVWKTTEKSVRKWMEWSTTVDNVQISWAPTWSLMNANYYIETCNWWLGLTEELLRGTSGESWNLVKKNFIFGPNYYQMSLLSNKDELKQKAKDYIEELENSSISGIHHIIEMTEAYIKFFDKDAGNEDYKLKMYYKMTEALDESRSQSLKKMITLTYESMYNRKAEE